MKLHEIKLLTEAPDPYGMWTVFQVSSPNTDDVYYGYTQDADVRKAFLAGGNRSEPNRGDVRMVNAAGGPDELVFKEVGVEDSEFEAFMERNDLRAKDNLSITGPSAWPQQMFERAKKEQPDRVARWKLDTDLNTMTAREAQAAGAFSFDDLMKLTAGNPKLKKAVTQDLDKLLYPAFKAKYLS